MKNTKPKGKRGPNGKLLKGFACLTPERRTEIAQMGGRRVAKKYGRRHMSDLGVLGGINSQASRRRAARKARV